MAISTLLASLPAAPHPSRPSTERAETSISAPSSVSSPSLSSCDASDNDSSDEKASSDSDIGSGSCSEAQQLKAELASQGFVDPCPDFLWMTTEEPHRSRRIAILKAHPEVRKLMGPTPVTFPLVLLVLSIQLSLAIYFRASHPFSLPFILTAYVVGGTANQNIFLAIHEITHNLAFKSIKANKALAIVANLAIGVPYAMAFKGYHIEHHKFLGEEGIDTDLPSRVEAMVLNNVAGKTFFATFQLLFYAIRPGFIRSQTPTKWHAYNFATILSFDALLVYLFGWRPVIYLIMSSFFAGSLHPCAAHFIAEHYLMEGPLDVDSSAEGSGDVKGLGQETTSYYGWLNALCYNVGYHNEHHDFPSVPWTRLPELRRLAKEFYDPLPSHKSWPYVTWKFITDPSVGMWSRAKRTSKGERIDSDVWTAAAGHGHGEEKAVRGKSALEAEVDQEDEEIGYGSDRDEGKRAKVA